MKITLWISVLCCAIFLTCSTKNEERYIFFLHNRFLEIHDLEDLHPEFGKSAYLEIIAEFKNNGFKVLSEKRNGYVNARDYALLITAQIDSLI